MSWWDDVKANYSRLKEEEKKNSIFTKVKDVAKAIIPDPIEQRISQVVSPVISSAKSSAKEALVNTATSLPVVGPVLGAVRDVRDFSSKIPQEQKQNIARTVIQGEQKFNDFLMGTSPEQRQREADFFKNAPSMTLGERFLNNPMKVDYTPYQALMNSGGNPVGAGMNWLLGQVAKPVDQAAFRALATLGLTGAHAVTGKDVSIPAAPATNELFGSDLSGNEGGSVTNLQTLFKNIAEGKGWSGSVSKFGQEHGVPSMVSAPILGLAGVALNINPFSGIEKGAAGLAPKALKELEVAVQAAHGAEAAAPIFDLLKAGKINEALQAAPDVMKTIVTKLNEIAPEVGKAFEQRLPQTVGETLDAARSAIPRAGQLERGFVTSAKESDQVLPQVKEGVQGFYERLSNNKTMEEAYKYVDENIDGAMTFVMSPGAASAKMNATGLALVGRLQEKAQALEAAGDTMASKMIYNQVSDIVNRMAQKATESGQATQILSMLSRLTPEGAVRFAQRQLDTLANTASKFKLGSGVNAARQLTPNEVADITALANDIKKFAEGTREHAIATALLMKRIGELNPSSALNKISATQAIAQLLNFKTPIRNIIGNMGFAGMEGVSDVVGAGLDKAASFFTGQRSKVLPDIMTALREGKMGAMQGFEDARLGIDTGDTVSKYGPSASTFREGEGSNFVSRLFNKGMSKAETALNLTLKPADRAFYQSAFGETLQNIMKATKVSTPTDDMIEYAKEIALKRTYQDDNLLTRAFSAAKKYVFNLGQDFGLGDILLKYPKVPANLILRASEYSPLGIANTIYELIKPAGLTETGKIIKQRKVVESLSRTMVGTTGLFATGFYLQRLGIMSAGRDNSDKTQALKEAMGIPDYGINMSALKRFFLSGFSPEEAKSQNGDKWITYDWAQPLAIALSMGASMAEGVEKDPEANFTTRLTNAVDGAMGSITSLPLMQGFNKLRNLTEDPIKTIADVVKDVPASFVPSLLGHTAALIDDTRRMTTDPSVVQEMINRVMAKIPGLSEKLPAKTDVFGTEMKRYDTGDGNFLQQWFNRGFNAYVNPGYLQTLNLSPEAKMVLEISQMTGEKDSLPRVVDKSMTAYSQNFTLTGDQMSRFQRDLGKLSKWVLSNYAGNEQFANLPADEREKLISKDLEKVYGIAKTKYYFEAMGVNYPKNVEMPQLYEMMQDLTREPEFKAMSRDQQREYLNWLFQTRFPQQ